MVPSILEQVYTHAQRQPDKAALIEKGVAVSYGAFWRQIVRYAHLLRDNGLSRGEHTVVVAEQTVAFLAVGFAIQLAGGVFVPLEKNTGAARIEEIMNLTGARLLVGAKPADTDCVFLSWATLEEKTDTGAAPAFSFPEADTVSEILFTTGTTGKSKGVVLTFGSCVAVAENVVAGVCMPADNVQLIPVPLNHVYGLRRCYGNLYNGSTIALLDGVIFMKAFFDALDTLGVTSIALVPSALAVLFKLSGDRLGDYTDQLAYIEISSAELPEADKQRLCELMPRTRLYNIYGSSEAGCSCVIDFNRDRNLTNCIGTPALNGTLLFTDEDRREKQSSAEDPGLLATAGPTVMKGYFAEPALTEETLRDGVVFSNDLAYRGDDGRVYLVGRRDDVINVGGRKVAPAEMEQLVLTMEGIEDCACVGVPDEMLGQVPKLFVVMQAGAVFDERAVLRHLESRAEPYKRPRLFEEVTEIPRSFNGKVLRRQLRDKP